MDTNNSSYNQLTSEILLATGAMQKYFPALYAHLDETPLFLSPCYDNIEIPELQQYLETVTLQLSLTRNLFPVLEVI